MLEDSNAGGGGERVLWSAIAILQAKEPEIVGIIYSGDIDATKTQVLDKVKVIDCLCPLLELCIANIIHFRPDLILNSIRPEFTLSSFTQGNGSRIRNGHTLRF